MYLDYLQTKGLFKRVLQSVSTDRTRLGAALLLGCVSLQSLAGSYSIDIGPGASYPLAWSFQNKTVSNAFPTPDDGTTLYFWNPTTQSYVTKSYAFGTWDDPNYVITNGCGFYYQNPTVNWKTVTVSGTDLTSSSVTFNFTANNWYFLGSAYLQPNNNENYIECVYDGSGSLRYTLSNLGYNSNIGDIFQTWNSAGSAWVGGERKSTNGCPNIDGGPYWESTATSCAWAWGTHLSAKIEVGHGFWFKPSANNSWTQYPTQPTCP